MSLICRHNRFTADCPICAKGTPLDPSPRAARRPRAAARASRSKTSRPAGKAPFSGPYVSSPARRGEDDVLRVVRLERVPGGVRLGEWEGAALTPRAPRLAPDDLVRLLRDAGDALEPADAGKLVDALTRARDPRAVGSAGVSRGRAGDFHEELRVEPMEEGLIRVARWVRRPSGWELRDAPPMLPAARYAEAVSDAVRLGILSPEGSAAEGP